MTSTTIQTKPQVILLFAYDIVAVSELCDVCLPIGLFIAQTKGGNDTYIPIMGYREHLGGDYTSTDEYLAERLAREEGFESVEVLYVSFHYVPAKNNEEVIHQMFKGVFEETLAEWQLTHGKRQSGV